MALNTHPTAKKHTHQTNQSKVPTGTGVKQRASTAQEFHEHQQQIDLASAQSQSVPESNHATNMEQLIHDTTTAGAMILTTEQTADSTKLHVEATVDAPAGTTPKQAANALVEAAQEAQALVEPIQISHSERGVDLAARLSKRNAANGKTQSADASARAMANDMPVLTEKQATRAEAFIESLTDDQQAELRKIITGMNDKKLLKTMKANEEPTFDQDTVSYMFMVLFNDFAGTHREEDDLDPARLPRSMAALTLRHGLARTRH